MATAGMKLDLVAALERVALRPDRRHPDRARRRRHRRARARLVDGRQPEPARRAALRRRLGQRALERSAERRKTSSRWRRATARRCSRSTTSSARSRSATSPTSPCSPATAATPYDAIVAARPATVRLVMVGGVVLYGDGVLAGSGPATPGCETIDICGTSKFLCVATRARPRTSSNQTYAQIKAALERGADRRRRADAGDGFDFAPLTPLVTCP